MLHRAFVLSHCWPGQTIFHLHVHLIPRYSGDVADLRGGVRHVIPDNSNSFSGVRFLTGK
jgi:diadenosine tetraphosphate (Ap4A) HIT family hydrolase